MNFIKSVFLLLLGCHIHLLAFSQNNHCNLKISLLTCGPGDELYSLFGHSAFRVVDSEAHTDIIYNYGTFDFEDPDFYLKFVRGKLPYFVSEEKFNKFVYSYQMENRGIVEQVLNLTCEDKEILYKALQVNALEENKYYSYEFLFDNCSTRLRDIIRQTRTDIEFKKIIPSPPPTFRQMLHVYLNKGEQYWSKAGIDMLLGSRIDRKVKNEEAMFLPDYLMKGFDSAVINNSSLVESKKTILQSYFSNPTESDNDAAPSSERKNWLQSVTEFTPLNTSLLILFTAIALTFINVGWAKKILDVFDVSFFLLIGAIGWLILFMWFGTEHELCANNFNILWALPTHLPISFVLLRKKNWVKKYFKFTAVFYLLLLIAWSFLPQGMHPAFLPVTLLAGIRSFDRYRKQ